jgi:hypothetical protein
MNSLKNYIALSITLLVLGACTQTNVNVPGTMEAPPHKTAESPTPPVSDSEDNMSPTPDKEIEENENEKEEEQEENVNDTQQLKAIYAGPLGSNSELYPSFVNFQYLSPEGNGFVLWANSDYGITLSEKGAVPSFFPVNRNIGYTLGEVDPSGQGLILSYKPNSTSDRIAPSFNASALAVQNFKTGAQLLNIDDVFFHALRITSNSDSKNLVMYSKANAPKESKNVMIGSFTNHNLASEYTVGTYGMNENVLEGFLLNETTGSLITVNENSELIAYELADKVLSRSEKLGEVVGNKYFSHKNGSEFTLTWLENDSERSISVFSYSAEGSKTHTVQLDTEVINALRGRHSDIKLDRSGNGFVVWTDQRHSEVYTSKIQSYKQQAQRMLKFGSEKMRSIQGIKLTLNEMGEGFVTVSTQDLEVDERFKDQVVYKLLASGNIYAASID